MKSLLLSLVLLLLVSCPIFAQEATVEASPSPTPEVMGLYDEELDSTASATPTPSPTATASARTTTYLDPTDAPVSGSVENTIIILAMGIVFITLGIRFSRD